MRIMIASNLLPPEMIGGYEVLCAQMAGYLASRHEVRVVTSLAGLYERRPLAGSGGPAGEASAVPAPGYEVRRVLPPPVGYALERSGNPGLFDPGIAQLHRGFDQESAALVLREVEDYHPDLIYAFNPLGVGPIGVLAVLAATAPLVVHLQDPLDLTVGDLAGSDDLLGGLWSAAKARSWAISCSSVILPGNSRIGRFARVELVPNWVPPVAVRAGTAHRRDSGAGGRQARELRAVYFGQLLAHKGADRAVEAAGVFNDRFGSLSLDVYGDLNNSFAQSLTARTERSRWGERVRFLGRLPHDELLAALGAYDVAILPLPESEPGALAVLEAMSVGCPVVTTCPAGATEWLAPGDEYLPIPPQASPVLIAETLAGAVSSGALEQLGEASRRAVEERFDLEGVVGPRVEEILAEAAAHLGPGDWYGGLRAARRLLYARRLLGGGQVQQGSGAGRFRYRLVDEVVEAGDRLGVPWGLIRDRTRLAGHLARRIASRRSR